MYPASCVRSVDRRPFWLRGSGCKHCPGDDPARQRGDRRAQALDLLDQQAATPSAGPPGSPHIVHQRPRPVVRRAAGLDASWQGGSRLKNATT
jgi:hypothetical protein